MKKLLLILLCFPMIGFGQQTYVPDDNFEAYLEANGMGNGILNDDHVATSNINTVGGLYVSNENISDLTGIEDFIALVSLECNNNQLTTLDLSNNPVLSYLECVGNQLLNLDLSQNPWIDYLYCQDNLLTSINITSNLELIVLRLDYNQLTSLDLSNNINLEYLDFYDNNLTSIDLSQNTGLIELRCGYNQLTSLDVTQNPNLEYLISPNNLIDNIDLSQNPNLIILVMPENNLTDINLSNNTNLLGIYLENNLLSLLDVSYQNNIQEVICYNNQISNLEIISDSLKLLVCGNNPIPFFNAPSHSYLESLEIYNTDISYIDLSDNIELSFLSIGSNVNLIDLDLSNNVKLTHLDVFNNSLQTLDIRNGNNHNMTYFLSWGCWDEPWLECINVDDPIYSTNNWLSIDVWQYFSNNCEGTVSITENTISKEISKKIDLLARETKQTNQPLFYIYDDGTVEKKIIIE